jgi:dolichyl-phosphate-mannose--protein O-mannosyl transferase
MVDGEDSRGARRPGRLAIAALLLVVSAVVHLVALDHPREVVFDEVHFGKYVTAYAVTGERFFDIHPPHAKLLAAGAARLGGLDRRFAFARIGDAYRDVPVYALRLVPALSGIGITLVFFLLLGQLGGSPAAAFLGGLLVTLDNAIVVQTRFLLLDGPLVLAILASLSACLAARKARRPWTRSALFALCGALAGFAVGVKWTGLTALALAGLLVARDALARRSWRGALSGAATGTLVLVVALAVYAAGWALHWSLLDKTGTGDLMFRPSGSMLDDTLRVHRVMYESNRGLAVPHHDGSPWYGWPVMAFPIYYWKGSGADVYFLGNPVVWWGSAAAFGAILSSWVLGVLRRSGRPERSVRFTRPMGIAFTGFLVAYLPYAPISRPLFLYHYLPPLAFMLLFVVLALDEAGWIRPGGLRAQSRGYALVVAGVVGAFLLFAPLTFGIPCPDAYRDVLFGLFPRWR